MGFLDCVVGKYNADAWLISNVCPGTWNGKAAIAKWMILHGPFNSTFFSFFLSNEDEQS